MMRQIDVAIGFDLVCPWCLIGKRNYENALQLLAASDPGLQVQSRWIGVQLLPAMPAEGVPLREFYLARLGGEDAIRQRQAMVLEAARLAGVKIDFARIRRMPNTAAAHGLLERTARDAGAATHAALLERLFEAYFREGRDIGDVATLNEIGAACGLAATTLAEPAQAATGARTAPGAGVPFFLVDSRIAVAGAQPPEALAAALREAAATGTTVPA